MALGGGGIMAVSKRKRSFYSSFGRVMFVESKGSIPLGRTKNNQKTERYFPASAREKNITLPNRRKKDNAGTGKKNAADKKMLHFQNSVIIIKKISKYGFFLQMIINYFKKII
jgi:hypothetical protein